MCFSVFPLFFIFYFFLLWLQVPASINCRLLEHQREGVKFLYGLYKNNHGGILGDDMYECFLELVSIFFFFLNFTIYDISYYLVKFGNAICWFSGKFCWVY